MRTTRGHLAPFRESPRPWLVVARNAVPVIGVYALGWRRDVALFEIWFDGITALGAMVTIATIVALRDDPDRWTPPEGLPRIPPIILGPLFWLFPFVILGIPYWFTIAALQGVAFEPGLWGLVLHDGELRLVLLAVLASNVAEHLLRGSLGMSVEELRPDFDWEIHMHLARVAAILAAIFLLPLGGIVLVALALAYVEIYPLRALKILAVETLDPENERRSLD